MQDRAPVDSLIFVIYLDPHGSENIIRTLNRRQEENQRAAFGGRGIEFNLRPARTVNKRNVLSALSRRYEEIKKSRLGYRHRPFVTCVSLSKITTVRGKKNQMMK